MKNIFRYFAVAIVLLTAASCEKADYTISDSIKHVAFEGLSSSMSEGVEVMEVTNTGETIYYDVPDTLRIPVYLSTKDKNLEVTVNFDFGGTAVIGENYIVTNAENFKLNGSDVYNYLEIISVDNEVVGGDLSIEIAIAATSNNNVEIGIGGNEYNFHSVNLIDDEHPLAFLFGNYNAVGYSYFSGDIAWQWQPEILSVSGSNTEIDIRGILFPGEYENPIRGIVDLENNTITIPAGQILFTHGTYGDAFVGVVELVDNSLIWHGEEDLIITINTDGSLTWGAYGIHVSAGFFDAMDFATWTKN